MRQFIVEKGNLAQKFIKSHKKLILISFSSFIFVSCIILVGTFFISSKSSRSNIPIIPTPIAFQNEVMNYASNLKFKRYTSPEKIIAQNPLYTYELKESFTSNEIKKIAENFSLSNIFLEDESYVTYSETKDIKSLGTFTMNKDNGFFTYQAYSFLPASSKNPKDAALSLIKKLGFSDGDITCPITYQQKGAQDITFVECHRDWGRLTAPLFTLPGIINHGGNFSLSTMGGVGMVDPDGPADSNIVNVSTGQNGKVRPNDFNSITVGVTNNGAIYSVYSRMRYITGKSQIAKNSLKTYEEAFSEITKNPTYSFSMPIGVGITDFRKVYKNNEAVALEAQSHELGMAYLEYIKGKQKVYEPFYLLYGSAEITSGYTIKYIQAIPASKLSTSKIAQESTDSLQLRTFNPPIPTPTVEVNSPTEPTPRAPIESGGENCRTGPTEVNNHTGAYPLVIPGYGTMVVTIEDFGHPSNLWVSSIDPIDPGVDTTILAARNAFFTFIGYYFASEYQNGKTATSKTVKESGGVKKYLQAGGRIGSLAFDQSELIAAVDSPPLLRPSLTKVIKSFEKYALSVDNGTTLPDVEYTVPVAFESLFYYERRRGGSGQCYLTGASGPSPVLFMYADTPTSTKIINNSQVTYVEPGLENNMWNVSFSKDGITQANGQKRSYLYYEFDRSVSFTNTNRGYVVKREDIGDLVGKIAKELKLSSKETKYLHMEFEKALLDVQNSPYIAVILADTNEVAAKLPLGAPAGIHTYRYHFLVSGAREARQVIKPTLSEIKREGTVLIELGVSPQ